MIVFFQAAVLVGAVVTEEGMEKNTNVHPTRDMEAAAMGVPLTAAVAMEAAATKRGATEGATMAAIMVGGTVGAIKISS